MKPNGVNTDRLHDNSKSAGSFQQPANTSLTKRVQQDCNGRRAAKHSTPSAGGAGRSSIPQKENGSNPAAMEP